MLWELLVGVSVQFPCRDVTAERAADCAAAAVTRRGHCSNAALRRAAGKRQERSALPVRAVLAPGLIPVRGVLVPAALLKAVGVAPSRWSLLWEPSLDLCPCYTAPSTVTEPHNIPVVLTVLYLLTSALSFCYIKAL